MKRRGATTAAVTANPTGNAGAAIPAGPGVAAVAAVAEQQPAGAADAKAAAALAAITTLAADHIGFCLGVWAVKPRDASVAAASPGPPRGAVTTDTTRATGATVAAITE
ncbi:Uncharacterised protein [Mycobacterium tuberculosis]|nr:Uncharacterised protein [Mycobacterium tuberculosis]CKO46121.1 Uncharacterised protein [Mycobacterium tuberculosis]CNM77553.1 Uncharacterised protein [Mycobacterium tuberculosis]